jgi:hypothetical protein
MCGTCETHNMDGGEPCPECGNNLCTCEKVEHEGACPKCGSKSCKGNCS